MNRVIGSTGSAAGRDWPLCGDEYGRLNNHQLKLVVVQFPSMLNLEACLNSPGRQKTAKHAFDISTGGERLFLTAEVESFDF